MPESATVEEIEQIYFEGWKLGLKALGDLPRQLQGRPAALGVEAVDRRCRQGQAETARWSSSTGRCASGCRSRVRAVTTSFTVGGAEGYMTASSYPDDGLGEVFLKMSKQGSTLAGMMDAFSIAISIALQYGVPLETYVLEVHQHAVRAVGHDRRPGRADGESRSSTTSSGGSRWTTCRTRSRSALGVHTAAERARRARHRRRTCRSRRTTTSRPRSRRRWRPRSGSPPPKPKTTT